VETKVNILNDQNLLDLGIQEYGTPAAAFDIAVANGIAISDALDPGGELILPTETTEVNAEVLGYYKKHQIYPATGNNLDPFAGSAPCSNPYNLEDYFAEQYAECQT
jgi:hypothetical protein